MKRLFVTFYEDDDMKIEIERIPHEGVHYLFAHVDVKNLTKKVYRLLKSKWEDLKVEAKGDGYEVISAYTQNNSFAKRVGKPIAVKQITSGGEGYEVYVWRT